MDGKTRIMRAFLILLISAFTLVPPAMGQTGRGKARISGAVTDEGGKPVVAAVLVIEFLDAKVPTKFETKSDKKGEWGFIGLGTGNWRVTAIAPGYLPSTRLTYVRQLELNPKITMVMKKAEKEPGLVDEASLKELDKGNQLFLDGKYDEAIEVYEQFLENNPQAFQIHLSMGDCYREKGDLARAMAEYNSLAEKAALDESGGKEMIAKALAAVGDCYLRQKDLENAQAYFKKSIEAFPTSELGAYNVAEILFSNQKLDDAVQYYLLAAQIKPDWPDPHFKLGMVYLNKADYEKAKEYLKRFLTLEKETERAAGAKAMLEQLEKIKKKA